MLIFIAILVLSGTVSVLFGAFLYYGFTGLLELFEAGVMIITICLTYLWYRIGPGRKHIMAEAQERYDDNVRFWGDRMIKLNDGREIHTKGLPRDKYGLPILPK